jgi:hypothetical protein
MDPAPDPAIFVLDLEDANRNENQKTILFQSFSAYYFLNVQLHHFPKIKSKKEATKQ